MISATSSHLSRALPKTSQYQASLGMGCRSLPALNSRSLRFRTVYGRVVSRSLTAPAIGYFAGYSWIQARTSCESSLVINSEKEVPASNDVVVHVEGWSLVKQRLRRAWRMLIRLLKLSFTLAPVVAFYPFLLLLHKRDPAEDAQSIVLAQSDEDISGLMGWYLGLCLRCVERSGAAVIKLMQWAGSRPDLFGDAFCRIFSSLQDSTTPHRWSHTEKVLKESFGENWKDMIRLEEILGSGCIGQVYRGHVKMDDGKEQEVAVKILHPRVEEDIDADLDLMRLAVRSLKWVPFDLLSHLKWLNLEGVVEEFAGLLKLQLDMRHEAANLERFNQNFASEPRVLFPKLIPGFEPTRDLLVESFCEGVPIMQFARENKENRKMLSDLCFHAIHAVCKMIFLDNFIHGDLHPGNVFVSRDGKKFVLLDVGIVAEYSERDHEAIVDILASFIRKQGRRAGRLMIDDSNNRLLAIDANDHALDEERFIDKIETLTIRASSSEYLMENLGVYITFICNAAAQHHVMLNPAFMSASLAVKIQEGIALALDPAIEIWQVATPVIVESERRRGLVSVSRMFGLNDFIDRVFGREKKQESTA